MLLAAEFVILCCVISQGKAVALDRWGGKWNRLSMTHSLTTDYAKKYCNRTPIVRSYSTKCSHMFFLARNVNKHSQSLSEYECENSKVLYPSPLWRAYTAPSDPLEGFKRSYFWRKGKGKGEVASCHGPVRLAPTHYLNSTAVSEWVALMLGHLSRQQCYIIEEGWDS